MSINKDSQKAPNLRFKGFTDDWEQRKLGEVSDVRDGTHASPKYVNQGHPMVTSKNLTSSGLDMTDVSFLTDEDFNEINKRSKVSIGDILFGMIGTIGNPVIVDRADFAIKNVALIKEKSYNPIMNRWLLQYLKSPSFNRFIQKENAGGTQKFIALGLIRDMILKVPGLEEQQKIGTFLRQIDNTITLHQRKLDQLNQLKEALLQQMFPGKGETVPKLRFAGFEGDWEERKLGDTLVELKSGLSRMLSNNDIGLPVIRANNIKNGMLNLEADIKYWYSDDPQGANTENYLVEKEDILINFINSDTKMGTAAIVREAISRNTIYTTNILKAQTNSDFNSYFWFTLTQTLQYKNSIKMITKPAVNQSSFTTVDFKKLIFVFPKLSEQSKIGKLFKELDNYIVLQSQKVNKLKLMKELLLQNMFI